MLVLQGQTDVSSVSNIFKYLCTEEGTVSGKAIFEGGFKFSTSEARNNFDRKASAAQIE